MFTPETFETAMHRFRTHPVQMALTLAGLVVGTAAIIIIVALGLTGRTFVMSQIEGVGSHLVWASYEGTVTSGVSRTTEDQITDADVRAIEARSDLFSGVTPLVELHGTVSVLSRAADLSVLGTTPNYATVRKNLRILRGRFLDENDISERAKVCVVSHTLYHDLFGDDALLPLPAGEGRGEGHLLPLPAGEGGGEGHPHHTGPEIPPSLRTRQKCTAMRNAATRGMPTQCST